MLWYLILLPILLVTAFWILILDPVIGGIAIVCLTIIAIVKMLMKRR